MPGGGTVLSVSFRFDSFRVVSEGSCTCLSVVDWLHVVWHMESGCIAGVENQASTSLGEQSDSCSPLLPRAGKAKSLEISFRHY